MFTKKKPEPEWRDYREKSYEELEKEVDAAYGEEVRQRNIRLAIGAVILFLLLHDMLFFWVRFATPRLAKNKINEVISVLEDPVQENFEQAEIVDYYTLEDKDKIRLRKQAEISMSGKVVAKNYFFWGNYLPGGKRKFQSAALFDLGLVWGDLSDKEMLKNYTFYSAKDVTGRYLYPTLKLKVKQLPLPWEYVGTHMAHIHVIPANPTIMSSLIYLHKNQPVKVDGYLVDVEVAPGRWSRTSMTRTDKGSGACEIMYVNKVQVGNKVYE